MPLPTQPVTCRFFDQSGNPVAGARATFRLSSTEVYDGIVAPEMVEATADASGQCVVELFPNELGVAGSQYSVRAWNPETGGKFLDVLASVPNSPSLLHEIMVQEPYPAIDAAEAALLAAQSALSTVTAQRLLAETAATDAGLSASSASASALAAADSEAEAALSAAAAATSAGSTAAAVLAAQAVRDDLADPAQGSEMVAFKQPGVGTVNRNVNTKLRDSWCISDMVDCSGSVVNATAAFLKIASELEPGETVNLLPGKTYAVESSVVFKRPVNIIGGTRDSTRIRFAAGGSYLASPYRAGFVFVHSSTSVPGNAGDALRSNLAGFGIEAESGIASSVMGVMACAPVYGQRLRAQGFTSHGLAVVSMNGATNIGNANGCEFDTVETIYNGGHGLYAMGDDANACIFKGVRAYYNGGHGFYDDSLLGNTYIGCEADANTAGAYWSTDLKPNRSVYLGCYAEPNQPTPLFDLNPRCTRLGTLGEVEAEEASGGVQLSGMPSGDGYINKPIVFASTDDVANALSGGAYLRLVKDAIKLQSAASGQSLEIVQRLSANYVDIVSGGVPAIRFPNSAFTENMQIARPYAPQGIVFGQLGKSAIVGGGTVPPTIGYHSQGAIWLNENATAGGFLGWVCVVGGTPGTWKTFGAISA